MKKRIVQMLVILLICVMVPINAHASAGEAQECGYIIVPIAPLDDSDPPEKVKK